MPQYQNNDHDLECLWCGEIQVVRPPGSGGCPSTPEKRRRGRPPVLLDRDLSALLADYDRGCSEAELARLYGLHRTTLRGYLERAGRKEKAYG
jgi:hypothetical protein